MRSPPGGKRSRRKKEEDGGKSIPEAHLKPEWKARDFLIYMGKKSDLKDLKNTEIQLVFLRPLFFCRHIGWRTQGLLPKSPSQHPPPPLSRFSSGARLPEDGTHGQTSETYFYQRSSSSIFSIFYFPQLLFSTSVHIVHLSQAMFSGLVIYLLFLFPPPPSRALWARIADVSHTHTHVWEV